MELKKWVQHISGQGEKWEVTEEWTDGFHAQRKSGQVVYAIPRSEYIPCDPPEQWEDVTGECTWSDNSYHEFYLKADNGDRVEANCLSASLHGFWYRVRKVQLRTEYRDHALGHRLVWAFIVERRKS